MNKFYYSRTYIFDASKGRRRDYFFGLSKRCGAKATFLLHHKDNIETVESDIALDGDTETATFTFQDTDISLRADRFIPKGYRLTTEGQNEKTEDKLRDAHLHTSSNRSEIENSKVCYCISCQTFLKPEEVVDYTDNGETAICPYCYCDAIIADGSGVKLTDELLADLHNKYFSYDDIDDGMEIYIATDLLFVEGAYRFNAVYAFKSMTSVKSYEKYLKSTGEDHKLIVTPYLVSDLEQNLQVITKFEMKGDLVEYRSTKVLEDYDDARDYVANIKDDQPTIKVEHDSVRIRSRFSPNILHCGFASF